MKDVPIVMEIRSHFCACFSVFFIGRAVSPPGPGAAAEAPFVRIFFFFLLDLTILYQMMIT